MMSQRLREEALRRMPRNKLGGAGKYGMENASAVIDWTPFICSSDDSTSSSVTSANRSIKIHSVNQKWRQNYKVLCSDEMNTKEYHTRIHLPDSLLPAIPMNSSRRSPKFHLLGCYRRKLLNRNGRKGRGEKWRGMPDTFRGSTFLKTISSTTACMYLDARFLISIPYKGNKSDTQQENKMKWVGTIILVQVGKK